MKIFDLHQDLFLHHSYPELFPVLGQTSAQLLRKAGVRAVLVSASAGNECENEFGVTEREMWQRSLDYYRALAETDEFLLVESAADITKATVEERTALIFHFEGWYGDSDDPIAELEQWQEKGLRSVGLAWVKNGFLAGGNDDSELGLTDAGSQVVDWLNEQKMILDFAHLSEKAFNETVSRWKKPVVVSHANVRALSSKGKERNLSDEQLKMVAESDGLVGLMFSPSLIKNDGIATLADVVSHITYLKNLVGIDRIAIGSDFGGLVSESLITGLENISQLTGLASALEAHQFSESEIEKVLFANANRVITNLLS